MWRYILIFWSTFYYSESSAQTLELIGHLDYTDSLGTDVWEYIDSSGHPYAIAGEWESVKIIDVLDPSQPTLVAEVGVPGFDVKVWDHYVYSVPSGSGGVITDIKDPENPKVVGAFDGFHNNFIDQQGRLFNTAGVFFDLIANPTDPPVIDTLDNPFGAHDITVVGDLVISCDGTDGTGIYRLTGNNHELIMQFREQPFGYHHQGDLSEDRKTLFIADEFAFGNTADIFVYDITDEDNPELIGAIVDSTATAHNLYVRGNYLFISYYAAGLKVFDISNPKKPREVANYDTNPAEGEGFMGAWGVYPSEVTDNIYLTDRENGLFIFRFSESTSTHLSRSTYFSVFPNPAQGEIQIKLGDNSRSQFATISNMQGQLCMQIKLPSEKTTHKLQIDDLLPGYHVLAVRTTDQILHKKILVH